MHCGHVHIISEPVHSNCSIEKTDDFMMENEVELLNDYLSVILALHVFVNEYEESNDASRR